MTRKIIIICLMASSSLLLILGLVVTSLWVSNHSLLTVPLDSQSGTSNSTATTLYIQGSKYGLLSFDVDGEKVSSINIYIGAGMNLHCIFAMEQGISNQPFKPYEMERVLFGLPQAAIYEVRIEQQSSDNLSYVIQTYEVRSPLLYYGGYPCGMALLISPIAIVLGSYICIPIREKEDQLKEKEKIFSN